MSRRPRAIPPEFPVLYQRADTTTAELCTLLGVRDPATVWRIAHRLGLPPRRAGRKPDIAKEQAHIQALQHAYTDTPLPGIMVRCQVPGCYGLTPHGTPCPRHPALRSAA